MFPLDLQIQAFSVTVAAGVILGLLFDLYRIFRGIARPGWFLTGLGDLLYWLVAVVVVFSFLIYGNWGEVRLYVFLGLILGVWLYNRVASRPLVRLLLAIIQVCRFVLRRTTHLFLTVVMVPLRFLRRAGRAIGSLLLFPLRPILRRSQALGQSARATVGAWGQRLRDRFTRIKK